ncbi:MAG: helix-turn-helix transcriptional regulator [Christensenellaceae bacterium]|nr:helix-turn-helix transcriptional regulator [Christensenellaceae bacterium]
MAFQFMRTERSILREEREKLGMTQQEVADKAHIQLRQYQRFEAGERDLSSASFFTACRVMEALGLDPSTYFKGGYVLSDEVEFTKEGFKPKTQAEPKQ